MRHTTRSAFVALSFLALAACGGETTSPLTDGTPAPTGGATSDAEDAPSAGATDAETGGATEDGGSAAGTSEVEIDDFDYSPESISVAAGTEVTWTNVDPALHSVTAGTPDAPEPELFDLDGIDEAGQTVSHTFEEPGTFAYFCRYHDFMTATVEVTG